jgi:hypothetical protein
LIRRSPRNYDLHNPEARICWEPSRNLGQLPVLHYNQTSFGALRHAMRYSARGQRNIEFLANACPFESVAASLFSASPLTA